MRPRSERAAYRRTSVMRPPRRGRFGARPWVPGSAMSLRRRSRAQLQCGLADADRLAGVDQQRSLDPLLVEVGAVGGAEVLDVPGAAAVGQAGVAGAGGVVRSDQGGGLGAGGQGGVVPPGGFWARG